MPQIGRNRAFLSYHAPPLAAENPCVACGRPIDATAWFCAHCAAPQRTASTTARDAAPIVEHDETISDDRTINDLSSINGAFSDLSAINDAFDDRTLGDVVDPTQSLLDSMIAEELEATIEMGAAPLTSLHSDTEAYVQRTGSSAESELSAFESFLLELVAAEPRAIGEIERQNVFAARELELGLLTLSGKGLISISDRRPEEIAAPEPEEEIADTIEPPKTIEEPPPPTPSGNVRRRLILPKAANPDRDRELMQSGLGDALTRLELQPKAEELYRAALRDQITGSVLSARMNLKLAIAFAPNEKKYTAALAELGNAPSQRAQQSSPAWKRYEEGRLAEARGDYDRAIAAFKSAIEMHEHGVFYNRLGIVLAQKKRELVLAERILRRALELDPENHAYVQNLARVLSAIAMERKKAEEERAARNGQS